MQRVIRISNVVPHADKSSSQLQIFNISKKFHKFFIIDTVSLAES